MCFVIRTPKQKAERDIVVYKVVINHHDSETFTSMYQDFKYTIDKVYTTKLSYSDKSGRICRPDIAEVINKGFHSYISLITARKNYSIYSVVTKCIIPKGAYYFTNTRTHERVSNKIKMIGIQCVLI